MLTAAWVHCPRGQVSRVLGHVVALGLEEGQDVVPTGRVRQRRDTPMCAGQAGAPVDLEVRSDDDGGVLGVEGDVVARGWCGRPIDRTGSW